MAESILALPEYHRFSKGIFAWVGYNTCFIPYTACERAAGTTKWSFKKLFRYAVDGIIGFSTAPLRAATYLGLTAAFASLIYLFIVVLQKLIWGIAVPGYASLIVLILLLGGLQLFCLGLIGEYVGKIFEQSKHRPVYLEKTVLLHEEKKAKKTSGSALPARTIRRQGGAVFLPYVLSRMWRGNPISRFRWRLSARSFAGLFNK